MHPLMTQYLLGKLKKMQISEFVSVIDSGIKKSGKEKRLENKIEKTEDFIKNQNLGVKSETIDQKFDRKMQILNKIRYNFGVKVINVRYMQ